MTHKTLEEMTIPRYRSILGRQGHRRSNLNELDLIKPGYGTNKSKISRNRKTTNL